MKETYTKKVFGIAMAVVVAIGMIYGLVENIKNGKCTAENNYCEAQVNKISDKVEIIENDINEFDEINE